MELYWVNWEKKSKPRWLNYNQARCKLLLFSQTSPFTFAVSPIEPLTDPLFPQRAPAAPLEKSLQHHLLLVLLGAEVQPDRMIRIGYGARATVRSAHRPHLRDEIEPRRRAQDGAELAPQDHYDQYHHDYRHADDWVEAPAVPLPRPLAWRIRERSRAGNWARSCPEDRGTRLTGPSDARPYGLYLPAEGEPCLRLKLVTWIGLRMIRPASGIWIMLSCNFILYLSRTREFRVSSKLDTWAGQ